MAQHDNIALNHVGLKGAVFPNFNSYGLTGKHGRRKARRHRLEALGLLLGQRPQQNVAGHTKGAEAMEDRLRKAGLRRHHGIEMQGIWIAIQAVIERLFGTRWNLDNEIGLSSWRGRRRPWLTRGPALAAIAAQHQRACFGRDQCAGRGIAQIFFQIDEGAFITPLVDDIDDARFTGHFASDR